MLPFIMMSHKETTWLIILKGPQPFPALRFQTLFLFISQSDSGFSLLQINALAAEKDLTPQWLPITCRCFMALHMMSTYLIVPHY